MTTVETSGLLAGKIVLVLGASRGIGAAAARAFAREGATLVLASRSADALAALSAELPGSSYVVVDAGDPDDLQRAVDAVLEQHGRLDAAFNNAGNNVDPSPIAEVPVDDFDHVIRLNLKGVFYAVAAEVRAMQRTGGGAIVNTSSVGSLSGDPTFPAYSAAKRGVNSITESAAKHYGPDGIRVNAIAPGLVLTEMVQDWEEAEPGTIDRITSDNPLGRPGTPDEIAEAAAWLLSDRSSYVTGVTLPVTGGTGL